MDNELFDDPSDWPIEFLDLKKVDSLLRCSICFDYFNVAVIVPFCSHNYCSLCIRKHVSYKKSCPSCNHGLDDNDLKPNRVLDELVNHFKSVRRKLLACTWKCIGKQIESEHTGNCEVTDEIFEDTTHFRNPKSKYSSPEACSSKNLDDTKKEINQDNGNMVNCPACQCKISKKTINTHLDVCLNDEKRTRPKRKLSKSPPADQKPMQKKTNFGNLLPQPQHTDFKEAANNIISSSNNRTRKPLPKMCIDVMSEKQMKNKLKSFKLPVKGDKITLKKRLKDYILIYNSECDSANPLPVDSIAEEVIRREKAVSSIGYKPHMVGTHDLRISIEEKLKMNEEHSKSNNAQFEGLVDGVRKRNSTKFQVKKEPLQHDMFGESYEFTIISPTRKDKECTRLRDKCEEENSIKSTKTKLGEHSQTCLLEDQIEDGEYVFETKQTFKQIPNKARKSIQKNQDKTVLRSKKRTDNKKQQSSSMIENYFSKVNKSKTKINVSYLDKCSIKPENEIFAIKSDSDSDHDPLTKSISQSIPESPDMFTSPYFNSTVLSRNSPKAATNCCAKSVSPIKKVSKRNDPRKIFHSEEGRQGRLDQDATVSESIVAVTASGKTDVTDLSFEGHLDELIDEAYGERDNLSDSDATLSDIEVIPDPPTEYDFTFTESQMF